MPISTGQLTLGLEVPGGSRKERTNGAVKKRTFNFPSSDRRRYICEPVTLDTIVTVEQKRSNKESSSKPAGKKNFYAFN